MAYGCGGTRVLDGDRASDALGCRRDRHARALRGDSSRDDRTRRFSRKSSDPTRRRGCPKDGDWRAGYVILDIETAARVEFVRVEYDVDEAMRGIRASDLPSDFAKFLRTGGKPTPVDAGSR